MSLTRVLTRASRTALVQSRNYLFSTPSPIQQHICPLSILCNFFHSFSDGFSKASPLHDGLRSSITFPHCGMSTSATFENEQRTHEEKKEDNSDADAAKRADEGSTEDTEAVEKSQETGSNSESQTQTLKRRRQGTKRIAFSDSDSEGDLDDLSREDLVKLVLEKEEALEKKQEEFKEFKNNFLRSYAEMENLMERTRREAENSKKFAVQSFAKSFLDVADNLGRASSVTKESFNKIDISEDTVGAVPLLKSLLEGVEMTEKQLAEVLRKAGIEKYDPTNEQFDPNRHNAVFQVPDNSKPPGTVAVVLKAGYTLHDRIIRPAEVGVTVAVENTEANS
ncbi:grpE protein homolog 2, mitochondrial isoform X1 [Amaranthus tricolor]|uniref:grpE protein homolog 2, mitochondrial isoform X1 n=1 Tax=Amaranthus tricolor TaxID=29722 RepID=UPI0025890AD7|nr:grpE protein homolog 2, mitochondrial isoform X1 [Amaranthus tricolor]